MTKAQESTAKFMLWAYVTGRANCAVVDAELQALHLTRYDLKELQWWLGPEDSETQAQRERREALVNLLAEAEKLAPVTVG